MDTRLEPSKPKRTRRVYRDPELKERMRKFQVVCKVELLCRQLGGRNYERHSIIDLGAEHFDLSKEDSCRCLGRARSAAYDKTH